MTAKQSLLCATLSLLLLASAPALAQDPFMGDWAGELTHADGRNGGKIVAQVIALGGDSYQINLLPVFDQRCPPLAVAQGTLTDGKVVFSEGRYTGEIGEDLFTGTRKIKNVVPFEMKKVVRSSPTLGAKPPKGAIVLFDGSNLDAWEERPKEGPKPARWKLVDGGAMQTTKKTGNIFTKQKFGDVRAHVEFRTPFTPEARGQGRGNSGVYMQGRFETQVLDSYGLDGFWNECGGIYSVSAPRVNMCAPPMEWQTYDIEFYTARFDKDGKLIRNAILSVEHNGVSIQKDVEVSGATTSAQSKLALSEPDSMMLQNHGNPVEYRNIWVVELARK